MNTKWHIRKATSDDSETIAGFNEAMALETEGKELDSRSIRQGVNRLMAQPEMGFYLVAEQNNVVAGSLMVTYEWSDWRDGTFWWIQSVYIKPEYRRQGGFRALYSTVEEMSRNAPDVCGVRLYVDRDNTGAQRTYDAMGMNECHYVMYEKEY